MNEQVARLSRERSKVRGLYALYLLGLLVCTLIFYFNQRAAVFCLLLCLVGHILVVRRSIKRYRADVRIACVRNQAERFLFDATFKEKGGVERSEVDGWRLLPTALEKAFLVRDCVQGRVGQAEVLGCDLTFAYRTAGRTQTEFLSGCWFSVALPKDTGIHLRVLDPKTCSEDVMRATFRDAVPFTHDGLEGLLSYLFCGEESREIPSDIVAMIHTLSEYTTGQLALCIDGDRVCFFLRGRFLSGQNVALRTKVSQSLLEATALPELEHIVRIIKQLDKTSQCHAIDSTLQLPG